MPRICKQRLKPLYLMQFLLEKSDEQHPVSVNEMIEELARHEISSERKSVYADLNGLRQFGFDVVRVKGRATGYFIGQRHFELPELKLLVDCVQSSKFITHKKTLSLIKKLEKLVSVYDASVLQQQVYVKNRIKSMNESVYYNVDEISGAIAENRMIRFKYFEYTVTKECRLRKGGEFYEVSPFSLVYDNENYYMLGWDAEAAMLKHYRVDKMTEISAMNEQRVNMEPLKNVDMSAYSKKLFGMFTGPVQTVKLRFANHLVGTVIDRFGKDIGIVACDSDHFTVSVNVALSPLFYAWLFGFGTEVEILAPEFVQENMKSMALQVAGLYK